MVQKIIQVKTHQKLLIIPCPQNASQSQSTWNRNKPSKKSLGQ
jgi:hypothetical protein